MCSTLARKKIYDDNSCPMLNVVFCSNIRGDGKMDHLGENVMSKG